MLILVIVLTPKMLFLYSLVIPLLLIHISLLNFCLLFQIIEKKCWILCISHNHCEFLFILTVKFGLCIFLTFNMINKIVHIDGVSCDIWYNYLKCYLMFEFDKIYLSHPPYLLHYGFEILLLNIHTLSMALNYSYSLYTQKV